MFLPHYSTMNIFLTQNKYSFEFVLFSIIEFVNNESEYIKKNCFKYFSYSDKGIQQIILIYHKRKEMEKYSGITVKAVFNGRTLNLGKGVLSEQSIKNELQLRFKEQILDLGLVVIEYEDVLKSLEEAFQNAVNQNKNSIKVLARIVEKKNMSEIKSSKRSSSIKISQPQEKKHNPFCEEEIAPKPLVRRGSIKRAASPQKLSQKSNSLRSRNSSYSAQNKKSNKAETIKTISRKNSDFNGQQKDEASFLSSKHSNNQDETKIQQGQKKEENKTLQEKVQDNSILKNMLEGSQIKLFQEQKQDQYNCFNCLGSGLLSFTTYDQKKCYVCQGRKKIADSNPSVKMIDHIVKRKFDKLMENVLPTLQLFKKYEETLKKLELQAQPQLNLEKKRSIFQKSPTYSVKINVVDVPQAVKLSQTFLPKFIFQNTGAGQWPKQVYAFDFYSNEFIKIKSLKSKEITQISFKPQKCDFQKEIQKKYRLFYYDQNRKGDMTFIGEDFGYKVRSEKKVQNVYSSKKIFELRIEALLKRAKIQGKRPELIIAKLSGISITYQNAKQIDDDLLMDMIQGICK